jgi:putative phosphoesterase
LRIAAISDIHARPGGLDNALIDAIHQRVEELSPDVFVIAGDVSESADDLERNLSNLAVSGTRNLYVAGNHDVWFEDEKDLGSLEKYSRTIGSICARAGFSHLPDEVQIDNGVAFVGSMGWYDYSFKRDDLEIPEKNYFEKQWKGAVWRDLYAIDWSYTDQEFTQLLDSKLKYDLKTLPSSVSTVIFVSHHLPFRDLTLYKDYLPWDFFSAFMGAESTGEILLNDRRVALSISGHSHIRRKIKMNGLTAITVPLGYGRPPDSTLSSLAHDAIAELEITDGNLTVHHYVEGNLCEGLPYVF